MNEKFKKIFSDFNIIFWSLPFVVFMFAAQVIDPHDSLNSLMVDYAAILGTLSQIIMILVIAKVYNIDLPKFLEPKNPNLSFIFKMFFITCFVLGLSTLFYCAYNYQILVKFFSEEIYSIKLIEIFQKPVYEWRFLLYTSLLTAPLVEEIIFRLYIYNPMRNRSIQNGGGVIDPIIVSSIYFALYHIIIYGLQPMILIHLGVLGVALAYTYEKTKVLWSSILLHFFWNVSVLISRSLVHPVDYIFHLILIVIGLIICIITLIKYLLKGRPHETLSSNSVPDTQE